MGISWQGDNLSVSMKKAGDSTLKKIKKEAYDLLPVLAEKGVEQMHQTMKTTRSALVDKNNRIWTGDMYKSTVAIGVETTKPNVYTIEYGWPFFGTPDYFFVQDHGGWTDEVFVWNYQWGHVSPMHSLLGAYMYTNQEFIKEAIRRWG